MTHIRSFNNRFISFVKGGVAAYGFPLVAKSTGSLLAFAMTVLVANWLGASEAGNFFYFLTTVALLSVLARMGGEHLLIREVSLAWGERKLGLILGMVLQAALLCMLMLSIIAGFLVLVERINDFEIIDLNEILIACNCAFLLSVILLTSAAVKGVRSAAVANFMENGMVPGIVCCLVFLQVYIGAEASVGLGKLFYLYACLATVLCIVLVLLLKVRKVSALSFFDWRSLMRSAPDYTFVALGAFLINWGGVFFLGVYGENEAAAIFAVANRVVMFVTLFVAALASVLIPKISILVSRGEVQEAYKLTRSGVCFLLVSIFPYLLITFIFSPEVMSIFGTEFLVGGAVLKILSVSYIFYGVSALGVSILVANGKVKVARKITLRVSAVYVALLIFLVPQQGAAGASAALGVALFYQAVQVIFELKSELEVNRPLRGNHAVK